MTKGLRVNSRPSQPHFAILPRPLISQTTTSPLPSSFLSAACGEQDIPYDMHAHPTLPSLNP